MLGTESRRLLAVRVLTIADGLFKVGVYKRLQNARMRAFAVIALKLDHQDPSLYNNKCIVAYLILSYKYKDEQEQLRYE